MMRMQKGKFARLDVCDRKPKDELLQNLQETTIYRLKKNIKCAMVEKSRGFSKF